jgi:CheY-like chemotaxis protein
MTASPDPHGKILFAEDNLAAQKPIIAFLERSGFAVTTAKNGREVLARLETERFDLLLLDCNMPVLDGFKTAEAIRKREAETKSGRVPIVAVTALTLPGMDQECRDAGMDAYLAKPVGLRELKAMIDGFLLKKSA